MVALPAGLDRAMLAGLALRATTRRKAVAVDLFAGDQALLIKDLSTSYQLNRGKILDLLATLDRFLAQYSARFQSRPTPAALLTMRLEATINSMTPNERVIVDQRVLAKSTRQRTAQMCGFTSARCAVLEARVRHRFEIALGNEIDSEEIEDPQTLVDRVTKAALLGTRYSRPPCTMRDSPADASCESTTPQLSPTR